MLLVLCFFVGQRLAGTGVEDATFYWLTLGTLSLLVAYGLATACAFRFLFLAGRPKAPRWQAIIPGLAGFRRLHDLQERRRSGRSLPDLPLHHPGVADHRPGRRVHRPWPRATGPNSFGQQ